MRKIKTIVNFREFDFEKNHRLTGQYSHKVDNKIYYQVHTNTTSHVRYCIFKDGKWVKPKNNICLRNSMAAHNFRVFKDKDGKYKAIGGYHTSKSHPGIKNHPDNSIPHYECYDPVWPKEERKMFSQDYRHGSHANGFYFFNSEDGINWETISEKPCFGSFDKIIGDKFCGVLSPDSMPSIVWDSSSSVYRCYVRANVRLGCRYVVTSQSKDLINWEKFQYIQITPKFNLIDENLYYFNVKEISYKDWNFISISPYFVNIIKNKDGSNREYVNCTNKVYLSKDGVNWLHVNDINFLNNVGGHMMFPHIYSYEINNNEFDFYVNEGYLTDNSRLTLYKSSIRDILL